MHPISVRLCPTSQLCHIVQKLGDQKGGLDHYTSDVSSILGLMAPAVAPNEVRNNWCHFELRDFDFETFLDFETKKQAVPRHAGTP